jgi:predicted alpha/beta hydrolase family esterase
MTATLIVPGCAGSGSRHWQSWLEAQIPGSQRVALPDSGRPDLSAWAAAVRWHIDRHSDPLLIVAHGFGCLAAVQAASDYSERIAGAMLVALPDPDNYRVTGLLPETPLAFPTVVVSSTNDLRMRSDKAAFWAGFWSASFVSIGAAGSIDEESGFGPWPQGLDILDQLRSVPPAHVAAAAKGINRATLAV